MKTPDDLHAEAQALLKARTEYQRSVRVIEARLREIDGELKLLKDEAAA